MGRAQALQWMFFDQYSHEPNVATVRYWITHHVEMNPERTLALYAYTHVAHEGGFDLSAYPNVRAWLDRVAADSPHIPITHGPITHG